MIPDNYPEIYLELIEMGSEALVEKYGVPISQARLYVFCFTEILRKNWAGQQPYFSKGREYERTLRDQEMYDRFNGSNYEELALMYGLTTRQTYDRIAKVREREFKRKQPLLFDDPA